MTAHDDAMPDDLSDAEAFDFDAGTIVGGGQRAAKKHDPARESAATSGLITEPPSTTRRAAALCLAAEPHHSDTWPCARHIAAARWQLNLSAVATSPVTGGHPPPIGAGLVGAAGCPSPASLAAPPSKNEGA